MSYRAKDSEEESAQNRLNRARLVLYGKADLKLTWEEISKAMALSISQGKLDLKFLKEKECES